MMLLFIFRVLIKFMLTCAGCGSPILHSYIKAMRKNWHVECFRCSECSLPIHKSAFKTKNHLPYHLACYQKKFLPICPTCGEPVIGVHIQALRHMYHPGHFICVACRKPIQSRSFHTHEGKPYCKEDFTRLIQSTLFRMQSAHNRHLPSGCTRQQGLQQARPGSSHVCFLWKNSTFSARYWRDTLEGWTVYLQSMSSECR